MLVREIAIAVTDASQVGEARRQVRQAASDADFNEAERETAALITTELATNLARHAKQGEIIMRCVNGADNRWLEILSLDRGPGMSDVGRCLEDGYSTGGTAGEGLGATRRLATEFDIHSKQPAGTVVLARVKSGPANASRQYFRWGVANRPYPGEEISGDAWRVAQDDGKLAIILVDGLGHGPLAADAAREAIAAFDSDPFAPLPAIIQRADAKMRGSRGGAIAIAQLDLPNRSMKYIGVGNIAGHLRSAQENKGRGLMSHNGTAGVQLRKIQEIDYPLPDRGLLVMHSDGLQSRWALETYPGLVGQHPAVIAGVLYRDFTRGHDDVTVAVVQMSALGEQLSIMGDDEKHGSMPNDLRLQNEQLLARLKASDVKIELLNEELAETNKGVVALYTELDEKAQELQAATELKSRFLSYMSHEFKTPLGSIRSIARILLDRMDGPLTSEQEKQVSFVQASAVELSEMVADLLDLAKIEAGRVSISPAWFEMVDLFAALRGMFKPLLTTTDVTLIFEEPVDLPKIYTDDKKLSQILRNFVSNSMKFTSHGEIRVSAERSGENNVRFSVADTGIGIAPENHAAIFQDFIQVDSPVQKKWRGTGLGLSLSKKNAELLGGTVAMESEPGKGSTFSVTIPIQFTGNAATADVAKPAVGQML